MSTSVVLDTNVVVSAVVRSGGLEDRIFKLALARRVQLFISPAVLAEYAEVLRRPKFKLPAADVYAIIAKIREAAVMVHPTETLAISRDESDNRFLECAGAATADYLVTGNTRHFPPAHKNTRVMTSRNLLDILGAATVGIKNPS